MADKNYIPGHVVGHSAFAGTVCLCHRTCTNDTVPTQFPVLLLSFSGILKVLSENFPS